MQTLNTEKDFTEARPRAQGAGGAEEVSRRSASGHVLLGRQPIYDERLEVFGYELLFRGGCSAEDAGGDRATSQVILNTLTEIGLERVVGKKLGFVNLTRNFIVGQYPVPLPRERVVLEVLEDVVADPEVIKGLQRLKRKGYTIALDDFEFSPGCEDMVRLADIVKLDVLGLDEEEIARRMAEVEPFGVELLAEKIETQEQFDICRRLGFQYFQGYFLARPREVRARSISPVRINLLRLVSTLQDPACELESAQEIVRQDVTLSYRFLRHMNSALYGMPRQVDSIRETMVYLGLDHVKNMATLFLLTSVNDKPSDLIAMSMFRAKMCELLAAASGRRDTHRFFTAGLLSLVDALMDCPMEEVLARLPLCQDLREALLERGGRLGGTLSAAVSCERGDFAGARFFGLDAETLQRVYLETLDWVSSIQEEFASIAS